MFETKKKAVRVTLGLLMLGSGLWLVIHFVHQKDHQPATPQSRTIAAYAPPHAEVHSPDEVKAIYTVRGAEVGPFQIMVSNETFKELAAASNYTALVTHDDGNGLSINYDYWLSRGDGAWYHASSSLQPPNFGAWFYSQWQRQDEFTWIAQPIYSSVQAQSLVIVGTFMALFGLSLVFNVLFTARCFQVQPISV